MASYKGGDEGYIREALRGGQGESNDLEKSKAGRQNQTFIRAFGMDNVQCAYPTETSLRDQGGFAGGETNLGHTLNGANGLGHNDTGEAGKVEHKIIPDH